MSAFQIIVIVWLIALTVCVGFTLRVLTVLTDDVERVEDLAAKVKHLFVKSTFEDAGEQVIQKQKRSNERPVNRG